MIVGWAINSAMILLAAATFFRTRTPVEELQQAKSLLDPLLGSHAGIIFAPGIADGGDFLHHNQWYGGRFYLCGYFR